MSNPENVCPTVQQRLAVVRAVEGVPRSGWPAVLKPIRKRFPGIRLSRATIERYQKDYRTHGVSGLLPKICRRGNVN